MTTVKVDAFELRKLILDTNMPITDDIWKFLNDTDLEYTDSVVFITKDGKEFEFVKTGDAATFLSEAVDYICEKEPHTLYIKDLVYKKVVTCKDCVSKSGCAIRMMLDFGDDFYCKYGSTNEDE